MNRQMKRMQERAERQQKRAGVDRQAAPAAAARRAQTQEKRKRTGIAPVPQGGPSGAPEGGLAQPP